MKRIGLYCVVSAALGVVAAMVIFRCPGLERASGAQEAPLLPGGATSQPGQWFRRSRAPR